VHRTSPQLEEIKRDDSRRDDTEDHPARSPNGGPEFDRRKPHVSFPSGNALPPPQSGSSLIWLEFGLLIGAAGTFSPSLSDHHIEEICENGPCETKKDSCIMDGVSFKHENFSLWSVESLEELKLAFDRPLMAAYLTRPRSRR
jgi:hypothetical protein